MNLKSNFAKIVNKLIFVSDSHKKTIFANICNFLMLMSLTITFCFYDVYPFNVVNKFLYFIISLLMLIYVIIHGKIKIGTLFYLTVALFFFIILSFFLNKNSSFQTTLFTLLITAYCFYLFYSTDSKLVSIALNMLLIAGMIFTVYFCVIYYKGLISLDLSTRLGDKISNQNDVAMLMITIGSIFFYYLMRKNYLIIPFVLLNIIETISTGSRSGLIFLFLIYLLIIYITFGYKNIKVFFISTLGLILLAVIILHLPFMQPLKSRFDDLFIQLFLNTSDNVVDSSTNSRLNALFEGLEMILYNPLFGIGNEITTQFTNNAMAIHNAYIEIGLAYGLIALIIYMLLSLYPINKLLHDRKKHTDTDLLLAILLISISIFLFTLSAYRFKIHFFIIALAFAKVGNQEFEIYPLVYIKKCLSKHNKFVQK